MEKTLYFVEVGVLLPPTDDEFASYHISGFHEEFGFYDENKLTFLTPEEAKKYGESYVEMGVENTYAILYNYICDVEDCDMDEINNGYYCEFSLNMPIETITDFFYKKNGKIVKCNDYVINVIIVGKGWQPIDASATKESAIALAKTYQTKYKNVEVVYSPEDDTIPYMVWRNGKEIER